MLPVSFDAPFSSALDSGGCFAGVNEALFAEHLPITYARLKASQTMLHGKEGDSVMPDSFRIVDERLAAERAAFHNSQVRRTMP